MPAVSVLKRSQVAKHNTRQDCWCIIHGKVYDLTKFLPEHPGGSAIILKYAGRDATKAFDPIHPSDIIEKLLPASVLMGTISEDDVANDAGQKGELSKEEEKARASVAKVSDKPALDEMLNLADFESVARNVMTPEAWAYYSSAADDEITLRENRYAFHRIWMKPRVLVNVRNIDISTTILGHRTSMPVYITATALARLGHPDGEVALTRAAAAEDIVQMIPTLASCSLDEITAARTDGQVQFFQLYVNQNRTITETLVRKAEAKGCKALFITVDAPQLGKREKDMRLKFINNPPDVQDSSTIKTRDQGAARAISSFIDPGLCWDDLKWFKSITSVPIILKGVQTAEDAVLAYQHGVAGIVLSNHGGRQLDYARSAIEILPEVMAALKTAGAPASFEVYVDGGIRRGTDIFKALALGAKAVGVGRPFLYAMSGYGTDGVIKAIQILKDELTVAMRLMGVTRVADIKAIMLCTRNLTAHSGPQPQDNLADGTYEPLQPIVKSIKSKL